MDPELLDLNMFFYKRLIPYKINYNTSIIIPQDNILNLFLIDLENHRKARLALYYHLHIQPSEINNMDYMDFEYLLMDLNEMLKELPFFRRTAEEKIVCPHKEAKK